MAPIKRVRPANLDDDVSETCLSEGTNAQVNLQQNTARVLIPPRSRRLILCRGKELELHTRDPAMMIWKTFLTIEKPKTSRRLST